VEVEIWEYFTQAFGEEVLRRGMGDLIHWTGKGLLDCGDGDTSHSRLRI